MDEFETYADVIDAYNSGVGVEGGESLTDYIKRNNIKIKEIEMDPIGDFEKILKGSKPMEKEGIETIQLASGKKDMNISIQEVVKEFIRKKQKVNFKLTLMLKSNLLKFKSYQPDLYS